MFDVTDAVIPNMPFCTYGRLYVERMQTSRYLLPCLADLPSAGPLYGWVTPTV